MRILLDVSSAAKSDPTGIGRYALELVRGLAPLIGAEDSIRLVVKPARWQERRHVESLARLARVSEPSWGLGALTFAVARRHDIFHSADVALPWGLRALSIATIHDTNTLDDATLASERWIRERSRRTCRVVDRADFLFAVSSFVRDRVLHHFPEIDPDRVGVTPLGADHRVEPNGAALSPEPKAKDAEVLARHGLAFRRYVLFVGRVERRKNPDGLVRGFTRSRRAADLVLAFAGPLGDSEVDVAIRETHSLGRVRFLDRVPDWDLGALYRGAVVFALPSRYEGFGIPLVEALACGTPSIVSDRTAQPEVAGGAALLVAPEDPEAIAAALDRMIGDEPLRRAMRVRALDRAREFTWGRCARSTLQGYRRAFELGLRDECREDSRHD